MATVVSAKVCQSNNCSTLSFVETTGAYNSLSNTTGWGTPNEATSDATSAVLTIQNPSGTIYTIDLFATTLFPTTNTVLEYEIPLTSIGLTASSQIEDGVYIFTYTVVTATTTYRKNWKQAFYCQVACCVRSMILDLDLECDCGDDLKERAIDAFLLLKGLMYSSNSGNISKFEEQLELLQKICLNKDCQGCK